MQLPESENEPDLFELVKTYQIHSHSRTWMKYNKNECRFSYQRFLVIKLLQNHLRLKKVDEKNEILVWRKTLLKKFKSYIDLKSLIQNIIFCTIIEHSWKFNRTSNSIWWWLHNNFYITGWWIWATSKKQPKFLFYKQIFKW